MLLILVSLLSKIIFLANISTVVDVVPLQWSSSSSRIEELEWLVLKGCCFLSRSGSSFSPNYNACSAEHEHQSKLRIHARCMKNTCNSITALKLKLLLLSST